VAQDQAVRDACRNDVNAKCGMQSGAAQVKACVKEHFGEFSENCQRLLLKARATETVCKADFRKYCPDVEAGGGRISACMREHHAELSEPCKEALAEAAAGKS
jgi:hypothetical protein